MNRHGDDGDHDNNGSNHSGPHNDILFIYQGLDQPVWSSLALLEEMSYIVS